MRTEELKKKLVEKGIETEKKAENLIVWYEGAALALVLMTCVIFDMITEINLGILQWIVGLIAILLAKNYLVKNYENNFEKIVKNTKIMKFICLLFWAVMVISIVLPLANI